MHQQSFLQRIKHPAHLAAGLCRSLYFLFPNDRLYLKTVYRLEMGKSLHLRNPKTFSEKLQWLKLYDRNPLYTKMVDKIDAKSYVSAIIGEEYIIPTLGIWNSSEEIEWDKLPNKFVIKASNGGGGGAVFICKDKDGFDKQLVSQKLQNALRGNIYNKYKEWPYKNIKSRIIAEELLEPSPFDELKNNEFICFENGCNYCQVVDGRDTIVKTVFFDRNWNPISTCKSVDSSPIFPNSTEKPHCLNILWRIAEKFSEEKSFQRVNFHKTDQGLYIGEVIFSSSFSSDWLLLQDWNLILNTSTKFHFDDSNNFIIKCEDVLLVLNIVYQSKELCDFKVFCFNGEPKMIKVNYDTKSDYKSNWYTTDWEYIDGTTINDPSHKEFNIAKPLQLDKMLDKARMLSDGIPFLRVDFYLVSGQIKFGELTFFPGSGFEKFVPESFDEVLGSWLSLNK